MAREHANIRLDMWGDDHWRMLTVGAQQLYLHLLTSPTLSYAGVADWRPARLAGVSRDATIATVTAYADELQEQLFAIRDDETEEILVRSFLKHDGLLHKPNVAKAMVAAFTKTVSPTLRGIIVHELKKLQGSHPEWRAFALSEVSDLLTRPSVDPSEIGNSKGSGKGSSRGSEFDPSLLTTNYPLLATSSSLPAAPKSETYNADLFEAVWQRWPKKDDKKSAAIKWPRAVEEFGGTQEELAAIVCAHGDAYRAYRTKQFTPALIVWLNKARWLNDVPEPDESKSANALSIIDQYRSKENPNAQIGNRDPLGIRAGN